MEIEEAQGDNDQILAITAQKSAKSAGKIHGYVIILLKNHYEYRKGTLKITRPLSITCLAVIHSFTTSN